MDKKQSKLLKSKVCAFCGKEGDITRDHIPPRGLFGDPKPSNLITVPSCATCNNSSSADDQYFVTALSLDMRSDAKSIGSVNKKTRRGLLRQDSRKFKENLLKNPKYLELRSPNGLYAGNTVALTIEPVRLWKTIEKIAKDLVYKITEKVVSAEYVLTTRFYYQWEDLGSDFPFYIMNHTRKNPNHHYSIGDGVFECYGFEIRENWFWMIDFYRNHRSICIMSHSIDPELRTFIEDQKEKLMA